MYKSSKYLQDLCAENYTIPMKEIQGDLNRDILRSCIR